MISKAEIIKCSVANFTQFGSKHYSLDELASSLGISKKTIYNYFESKEALVVESVAFLIEDYLNDIKEVVHSDTYDPLTSIILIYKKAFEHLEHFKPSFIFGLKKYYPKANALFDDLRSEIVNKVVFGLLEDAKQQRIIKQEVNLQLFCDLYFKRFEEITFRRNNLVEQYTQAELLRHFIVYSLKGITVPGYSNSYLQ